MVKLIHLYTLILVVSGNVCKGQKQQKSYYPTEPETKEIITSHGPLGIVRNIKQDKKGHIWIAAFSGIFRYDGKSFTNITSDVSSARFFDVLEDKKGNLWFASVGSGVYYYDGKSFQHFTTKEGLMSDVITHIYEDKSGNIWFGASRWDGKSFQNFKPNEGLPDGNDDNNDVNSIIEDKTGKFWFATRGKVFTYDGKKFTVVTHNGKSFSNTRTIIEDKKGDIWLGGEAGLWRYSDGAFTNITYNSVGYVYEDKDGNIWTSSQPDYNGTDRWAIARYDANTLSEPKPTVTDIMAEYEDYKNLFFGILVANDGSVWFGSLNGVFRYDGKNIVAFTDK
ncbi:two-component regulator propeller domain-containing protein [Emticicia sp. C21]|uniref:ligand-binding sensor domain-containing protein n=1 Tax=Emticicia sp. C21 TaxID=2302915 RepID=UPI000E34A6CE|nr:two-component regulator propeller domain-containing protein [Emticicia sp. C21]RFS16923.1 histidine kinase [Emticicia sp. C21]